MFSESHNVYSLSAETNECRSKLRCSQDHLLNLSQFNAPATQFPQVVFVSVEGWEFLSFGIANGQNTW